MTISPRPPRGRNVFKQRDVARAVRSAQVAGLTVGGVEVVTKDGTTIRILTENSETGRQNDKLNAIIARLDVLLSQSR